MTTLDEMYHMGGDGEGGVMLQCRICDRRGRPVVYHTDPGDRTYDGTDVMVTHTIADFLEGAAVHQRLVHSSVS